MSIRQNEAAEALEHLARRVWRKQALRHTALMLAVVLPVTVGAGIVGGWPPGVQVLVGIVLMTGGIALSISRLRRCGTNSTRRLGRGTPDSPPPVGGCMLRDPTAGIPPEGLPCRLQVRNLTLDLTYPCYLRIRLAPTKV